MGLAEVFITFKPRIPGNSIDKNKERGAFETGKKRLSLRWLFSGAFLVLSLFLRARIMLPKLTLFELD